jgi:hypothetical protein
MKNTLAYYAGALVMMKKSFVDISLWPKVIKLFISVIY